MDVGEAVIRCLESARIAVPLLSAALLASCSAGESPVAAGASPPYRDLNHNGQLDPYEDSRLSPEARADDLVKRMTLEEKAGAMMHDTLPGVGTNPGASAAGYDFEAAERAIG